MSEEQKQAAIDLAKQLGTYKQADRAAQYAGRYSNEILKRNDDLLFQRQREYENRQFWHKLVLLVVGLIPTVLLAILTHCNP
jgi:hypothetical protein